MTHEQRLAHEIGEATRHHRAIGAFNVVLLEHAEAIVRGAEDANLPVILQVSENCISYHGAVAPIIRAVMAVARAATVPAFVHLDHIEDLALIDAGIELGVDSLMFDGSRLPYESNVRVTREVVTRCRTFGLSVEAELGEVGGKDGAHAPGVRTDPIEARDFVEATGVDLLAVAVGTSHAMSSREAAVDADLIRSLRAEAGVPLVLHGSSGLPDEQLAQAVEAGMTKVNISTHLNGLFTNSVRRILDEQPHLTDPRRYVEVGREAIAEEVARLLRLLGRETETMPLADRL